MNCECFSWARIPEEKNGGKYPMSLHAPHCKNYKEERFVRISFDGSHCLLTPNEAKAYLEDCEDPNVYEVSDVFITQDQFENLAEFTGF